MITWEPWLNSFQKDIKDGKHVFELIGEGYFDSYISNFSEKLKNLKRPVFLRFAHEFDNPFYPWYLEGTEASSKFKKAWIHAYEIFQKNGVTNVIWIWNPWKSNNVESYYPGEEYVDWIGVDILNYGKQNHDGKWHEFESLYKPFHDEFAKLPKTPVIISEFGTLKDDHKQGEWFQNAFDKIENEFKEIKSVIYFNSKVDNNFPDGRQKGKKIDWTIADDQVIKNAFLDTEVPNYVFSLFPDLTSGNGEFVPLKNTELKNIKGINLKNGHDWRKDYHVLNRKNLEIDFNEIKHLGVNTIGFEGNSIYGYNILNITNEFNFKVAYGFWIPEDLDFNNDTIKVKQLKQRILEEISKQKHYSHIIFWNIQNDVLYNQKNFYHKPELLFQNRAYIIWLKSLVTEIKKLDKLRPIVVDIEVNTQSENHAKMLVDNVPDMDYLGLVVKKDENLNSLIAEFERNKTSYLFSEINVNVLSKPEIFENQRSFFITAWHDQHESNKLSFDGITDRKGRFKTDYFKLENKLTRSNIKIEAPIVRILKPATLIYPNTLLDYQAMYYDTIQGWKPGGEIKDLKFEWSLVKCDEFGNYLAIKDVGYEAKLSLRIPEDHELYRLLLTTSKGEMITISLTTLNTPLEEK
jgi:hypothetical protein